MLYGNSPIWEFPYELKNYLSTVMDDEEEVVDEEEGLVVVVDQDVEAVYGCSYVAIL